MSVAGEWNMTMDTPLGKQEFKLNLSEAAGVWSGAVVGPRIGTAPLTDIKVEGTTLSFDTNVNSPMGAIKLSLSGSLSGDALSGVCKTAFGNANFTGVRA
jgi:hypothetical protein